MPREECYGVIVVYKSPRGLEFLIVKELFSKINFWSFSKGHVEGHIESGEEAARRELFEETQISKIDLLNEPVFSEEYEVTRHDGQKLKINNYFIGFVDNKEVTIDPREILDYKWATFEEAMEFFETQSRKNILKQANDFLNNMVK